MGSIVSTGSQNKNKPTDNGEKQNNAQTNSENTPSVFVNSTLLEFDHSRERTVDRGRKLYEIDGKTYTENVQNGTGFDVFKLYAQRIDTQNEESVESKDTDLKTLDIDVQLLDVGYLINSTVCLSTINYNTLIMVLDDYYNCFVCDQIVCKDYIDSHITDEEHEVNMAKDLPLEKFGMSIARVKNDHYYCSVCNMSLHKDISKQHFNGKAHEKNLLLAANKVKEIKIKDTKMKNTINDTIRNRNNDKILNINSDRVIITEDKNEEVVNKNDYIMNCTVSLKVGKAVLKISYYTWNMISISKSPKNYTFYCMACKIHDTIVNMANHIADDSHSKNMAEFKINYDYEDHLIRQDDKFSHCGTCNTIHYLNDINIHIRAIHNKTKDTVKALTGAPKSELENNVIMPNSNNENRNNDIINALMNERCFVILLGVRLNVLLLSLNAIFRNDIGFYCALCKENFLIQFINNHLQNPTHIRILNSIPALQQFGYNYIRSIQDLPHCGICHAVVPPKFLFQHLQDPSHILLTNIALGNVAPRQPVAIAKIAPNVKNEASNVKSDNEQHEHVQNKDQFAADETRSDTNVNVKINDIDSSAVNENTNNDESNNDMNADLLECEVALKKANSQITLASYNTLVPIGDGDRYCFVCEELLHFEELKEHIGKEKHVKLIKDIKFVEEYRNNLIRQKPSYYHCSLCNVILRRTELKKHMSCPVHEEEKANMTNLKKCQLKKLTKHVYATQKEGIFREKAGKIEVLSSITLVDENKKRNVQDSNKVIMLKGYNIKLKLKWDAWHAIASIKNEYKCIICQVPLKGKLDEIYEHIDTEKHNMNLAMPFVTGYFPSLLREIGENVYNCVVCNIELCDKESILTHIQGKRHKNKYGTLLKDSYGDDDDDSSEDVLLIK